MALHSHCFAFHGGDVFKTSRSFAASHSHGLFFVLRFITFALVSQDWSLDPHALRTNVCNQLRVIAFIKKDFIC